MIRPYEINDKEGVLKILRLNTPRYFDSSEEQDFIDYLDHHAEAYYVVLENGKIVGSGGINYFEDYGLSRLSWDIIHPDFQGKGLGKKLALFRINEVKKKPAMRFIEVRTTQLAFVFYQKIGFKLEKTEKDFWARGFDLYQMKMKVNNTESNTTASEN